MAGGDDAAANKSSSKTFNKGSNSGGLQSFLQNDAAKNATKVDWENRSRGAYSTVSKMKSAVDRMNKATEQAPQEGGGAAKEQQLRTAVRKSKSDDAMDKLSSFLKKNAKSDDNIASDDRSRGAHSTMSHNLRRTKKPLHQPSSKASDAFFAAPSNVPQAAERKLPTGNPKTRSSSTTTKSQKNLEMFMSRQAPLPKQDLEVRSAFTSVDRARSYTMKTVPVAPLPTSKEDLLNLLRTTSAMSLKKTDEPSVRASASKIVLTQPLLDAAAAAATTDAANSSNAARSAPAKRGVRRCTSEDTASFNKKRTPPKRTRSKKASTTTTTTSSDSPTKQFSNILPAQALLDKPQAILPSLPGPDETALMRSQSVNELSNPLVGSSSTHTSPVKSSAAAKTGLAKTVHTTKASSRRKDAEGGGGIVNSTNTLGRTTKKKPSKSNNTTTTTTTSSSSGDKKNATSSKVMSARRLHHAPANSIPSSPIAGRRQSLKMGLAGTASGEGKKLNKNAAAQRNKKKKPAASSSGSKKPQRQQQQRSLKLPMTPDIRDHAENNETTDVATKRRIKTSSTGGSGPPSMPQRRKSADEDPVAPSRSKTAPPGRRRGGAGGGEALEDIFSFYTWSEARQPASKIMKERQVLRDTIMDGGPLHRAYNRIT